ncbi:DedA family protein/thiosulfate sulfurtransferase GlpE [Paraherbaspirillum soli]|uniref:DedA family protein/thiosulfate sulfurtransferase GlpE n=1 Tax=Paraherbaspirillum soli TaxID=631222 RepID=A0ABW0MF91_9BURK
MMQNLIVLIAQYGLLLVFANVLVEQLGLPLPAVPTMIVAGALAADGKLSLSAVFAVSLAACIIGDAVWYWAGRRFGNRVLRLLCRVSLSPNSCVMQAQVSFRRWGGSLLMAAKFVPGLSTMAPPMAGAMKLGWPSFLFFDSVGAIVWIGAAVGAGRLFHAKIEYLFARLESMGTIAIMLLAGLLALYIGLKWWQRRHLVNTLRMARISVDELQHLMKSGDNPVIVDVRSAVGRQLEPRRIPGALPVDLGRMDELNAYIGHLPSDREIILYCTCPNEISAAKVAKMLMDRGYTRVRPLQGGLEAWAAAGYSLEELSLDLIAEELA